MSDQKRKRIFTTPSRSSTSNRYEFKVAWGALPHPDKAWKGGEDAVYASKNALVVADGVSGWSKMGIDAGIYSRKLLLNIKALLEGEKKLYYIEHPDDLALKAVQQTQEKGSATLTVLTLHPNTGVMRSYHVGDSIYAIFRRNGLPIIAEEQQKQFDMPYQVYGGKINIIDPRRSQNPTPSDIHRGQYNQFSITEIENSPIVVASDGLWDNVHMKQIYETMLIQTTDLRQKTRYLLQQAMSYGEMHDYASPYYHKALKKGLNTEKGGKLDDVSIILAEIISISE